MRSSAERFDLRWGMNLEGPDYNAPFGGAFAGLTDIEPRRRPRNIVRPSIATVSGNWHYGSDFSKHRHWPWTAMAVSAALHVFLLYGFNDKPKPKKAAPEPVADFIALDLSKLKPDKDDEQFDSDEKPASDEVSNAPTIPDIPVSVNLNNSFIQAVDVSTLVPDLSPNKRTILTVPPVVHHGTGNGGAGMKDLFNLAELDRIPHPIYRDVPRVPSKLIAEVSSNQVVVEFIVNKQGNVVSADVVKEPSHELGDIALKSVLKWRFRPGMKGGRIVNTRVRQPIIFTADSSQGAN
ncbi:MAG TPA: TonB family protein [Opitutaceae bacterium]